MSELIVARLQSQSWANEMLQMPTKAVVYKEAIEMIAHEALRVANVLDAAAEYIEEHGFAQKTLRAPNGAVCMMGALREVARLLASSPLYMAAQAALEQFIRDGCGCGHEKVSLHNDHCLQEGAEATKLLREAADAVRFCTGE